MYSRALEDDGILKLEGYAYESVNMDQFIDKGNFAYHWFEPATIEEVYSETLNSYNSTSVMCNAVEAEKNSFFCIYYSYNGSRYYVAVVKRLETGENIIGTRTALTFSSAKTDGLHLLYKNNGVIELWMQCEMATGSPPKYNKCVFSVNGLEITLEDKEENVAFAGRPEHQISESLGVCFPYCNKKVMVVLSEITGENTSIEKGMAVTSDVLDTPNGTVKSCEYIGGYLYVTSDSRYIFKFEINFESKTITYVNKIETSLDYTSGRINPIQLKKYNENKFFLMYGNKESGGRTKDIILQDYEIIEGNPTLIATSTAPACGNTDQLIQPVRRTSEKEYDVAYSGFYGGEIVRVSIANDIPYFNIKPYNDYVRGMGAYLHQRQMLFLENYNFAIYIISSVLHIVIQEKDENFCFSKQMPTSKKYDICMTKRRSERNKIVPVVVSELT